MADGYNVLIGVYTFCYDNLWMSWLIWPLNSL